MTAAGRIQRLPALSRHRFRSFAGGVIENARRRQRRRRLRLALALLLAISIAAALANSPRGAQHSPNVNGRSTPGPPLVAPATVLSQNPYMGVKCPQPNGIACDRVGLAIWLKRPAISVNATIAGQPLKLDWFGEERLVHNNPRTTFDGYLQPAGIITRLHVRPTEGARSDPGCGCRTGPIWYGANGPEPLVQLQIEYPNHTRVVTQLHVGLAAGWG